MKATPLLVIGALAAAGGIAYAATKKDEQPPLPLPPDRCSSAQDVTEGTSAILSDPNVTADGCRQAAMVLRNWEDYCDDSAKQAAQASIQLLEAKAAALDAGHPSTDQNGNGSLPGIGNIPGLRNAVFPPPGYVGQASTTGIHGEAGIVYWYPNGDEWFVPNDVTLVPYFIPGGSADVQHPYTSTHLPTKTQGACCASCANGDECESECNGS